MDRLLHALMDLEINIDENRQADRQTGRTDGRMDGPTDVETQEISARYVYRQQTVPKTRTSVRRNKLATHF